jgi:iron complex outermembrane receptor protein
MRKRPGHSVPGFDKQYKTSGSQFINRTISGVLNLNPAGHRTPTLGKEGIASAFYGNPRQVLGTFTARF